MKKYFSSVFLLSITLVFVGGMASLFPFLAYAQSSVTYYCDTYTEQNSGNSQWNWRVFGCSTQAGYTITDANTGYPIECHMIDDAWCSNATVANQLNGLASYYCPQGGWTVLSSIAFSCPLATSPTVTTNVATNLTQTTATSGGNTTSNGGSAVTVAGIAWSTTVNPVYAGGGPISGGTGQTTNGWAIGGPWVSNITGLTVGTLYHVRAYAVNSVGTAYGADVTFTTPVLPDLTPANPPNAPVLTAGTINPITGKYSIGSTITFTVQPKNIGTVSASKDFNVRLQKKFSGASINTYTDVGVDATVSGGLAAGATASKTIDYTSIASDTNANGYDFRYCIDMPSPGVINESNEGNNCSGDLKGVKFELPDLIPANPYNVPEIDASSTTTYTENGFIYYVPGSAIHFIFHPKNQGGSFNSAFPVVLKEGQTNIVNTVVSGGLASGAIAIANANPNLPTPPSGQTAAYYYSYCVDQPSGSIVESDEVNNCSNAVIVNVKEQIKGKIQVNPSQSCKPGKIDLAYQEPNTSLGANQRYSAKRAEYINATNPNPDGSGLGWSFFKSNVLFPDLPKIDPPDPWTLNQSKQYVYILRTSNGEDLRSPASPPVYPGPSNSPLCNVVTLPPTPTGLKAIPNSCGTGTIDVSWDTNSGVVATSYTLNVDGNPINNIVPPSYDHTGLTQPGLQHTYSVSVNTASGSSDFSPIVTANEPAASCNSGSCLVLPMKHYLCDDNSPGINTVNSPSKWTWTCGNMSCSENKNPGFLEH